MRFEPNGIPYAWKGFYSAATQYAKWDVVRYVDGHVYYAKATPPLANLPTDTTYWTKAVESASGLTAKGDMLYRDGSGNITRLPIGANGQVLTVSGGLPTWGAGTKFLNASVFIDRTGRSIGNVARTAFTSGTVTRLSATSLMIAHVVSPQHNDSTNGWAAPYFSINGYKKSTLNTNGPQPAGCVSFHGSVWFSPTEGLSTTTGNMTWEIGVYSYDNTSASRGNYVNPTNSQDSRLWPSGHQRQSALSVVIYEIEP